MKNFVNPEMEMIRMEMLDVITTSGRIDYVPGNNETPIVPSGQ